MIVSSQLNLLPSNFEIFWLDLIVALRVKHLTSFPVLWIRIGFNVDPDPAFFYLNADTDPDSGSQTNADPGGSGSGSWTDF